MGIVIKERLKIKAAKAKASTSNGVATLDLKVPGVMANGEGRYIKNGAVWFVDYHADDYIKVQVVDVDNVLGYGAGLVIDSFVDTDVPEENQGWYISPFDKIGRMETLREALFIPAQLYIRIIATTGDTRFDTLRLDVTWGTRL